VAVLIGLGLGLGICLATPYNNMFLKGTLLGGGHFPLAPFFLFFWLAVFVAATARLTRTAGFLSGRELMGVFMLMVVVSGIPYTGLLRTFFVNLTAPMRFATPGNRFDETIIPLLPDSLYPTNTQAIETLYNGLPGGRAMDWLDVLLQVPWQAWIAPLAAWGAFILAVYGLFFCLANLLSRQWVENERMNFPLLRLPMAMEEAMETDGGNGLWRFLTDPWLLAGIALPVFIHTMNGLSFYYPQVPQIPTLALAKPYIPKTGLLSGFAKLRFYFYPAFIGFAFLTARQISLSLWVFYLLGSLAIGVLAMFGLAAPPAALGVTFGPTLAFPEETQMIGAYVVFCGFILWLSRRHLTMVAKAAVGMAPAGAQGSEWFSVRIAFWGLVLCAGFIVAWMIHFGMGFITAMACLGVFLLMTVVAARIICQGGIAYFTLTAAPLDGLLAVFGSGFFTPVGLLLAAAVQKVAFLDLRESLLPSLMHATKAGEGVTKDGSSLKRRLFFGGLLLAVGLGLVVSFAAMLALAHKYGLRDLSLEWETRTTLSVYENVQRLIEVPSGVRDYVLTYAGVGALIMLVLIVCYQRFYWWPLHPIGYLAAYSSAMRILWFSFLIGWACNQLVLRYGGVDLYRRVRFLFFGLIIGDFLMGGIWAIIGLYAGASYMVLPD
jgi:hypothetical protein